MTPIRRLLNIVQFDLAEKLNLARLRWYHLNHQDQYLQSIIYGNPDNCTLFRLREVLTNLLRANFLSYYILADTPESLSISIQGNAIITFVITKDNYITFTITKLGAQLHTQVPDEVIIPSRIYFDEGKRIDVKVWPKTIQLTGPTKDLNKVFKTLDEYDDWWHQFKKKNPDAFRKDAKYVKSINGLFLIQKRLYQIPNRSLS